jgi:uncharacterized protein YbcI
MYGTESDLPTGSMSSIISNAVVRLLSEYTGRRPANARTYIDEDLIIVVVHDTLTEVERSIVRNGSIDLVLATREACQKAMKPDLVAAVERLSGRSTIALLSQNHIDPDVAITSFVLAPRSNGVPVDNGRSAGAPSCLSSTRGYALGIATVSAGRGAHEGYGACLTRKH